MKLCRHAVSPSGPIARFVAAMLVALLSHGGAGARAGFFLRGDLRQAAENGGPDPYAIELEPNLESLTLAGAETVDIEVREPTARITVNAVNMTLTGATIDDGTQTATIALDAAAENASAARHRPAQPAHRLYRPDQPVRPRSVLRHG
jgi:hypothetical protein